MAGDQLVDGKYEPVVIEVIEEGVLQGYSAALGLLVRWERGQLKWHDPETGREIPTFKQERDGRLAEQEAKPIPRWDVHFREIDDDRKHSTAPHITFSPNWVGTDSAV